MTVYLTGDTHGEFKGLVKWANDHDLTEEDTIIVLGDNGLNFHGGWKDRNKKKVVAKAKCNFFIIRGNHDLRPEDALAFSPLDYDASAVYGGEYIPLAHYETFFDNEVMVENRFPNIKYAKDGLIYNINHKKCLVIGGAYSVDKFFRLMNDWPWIQNEQLSEKEMEDIFNTFKSHKVQVILSHTAPRAFEPFIRHLWISPEGGISGGWDNIDHTMSNWMNKFLGYDCQEIDLWYFGHYHGNVNAGPMGVMLYEAVVPFGEKAPTTWTKDNNRIGKGVE